MPPASANSLRAARAPLSCRKTYGFFDSLKPPNINVRRQCLFLVYSFSDGTAFSWGALPADDVTGVRVSTIEAASPAIP